MPSPLPVMSNLQKFLKPPKTAPTAGLTHVLMWDILYTNHSCVYLHLCFPRNWFTILENKNNSFQYKCFENFESPPKSISFLCRYLKSQMPQNWNWEPMWQSEVLDFGSICIFRLHTSIQIAQIKICVCVCVFLIIGSGV